MQVFIYSSDQLSSVRLPAGGPLRRLPPRPAAEQQPGYADTFDFHTLFYDCFALNDGRIRLIGPPPLNLLAEINAAHLQTGACKGNVGSLEQVTLQRTPRGMTLDIPAAGDDTVSLMLPSGDEYNVVVQPSCHEVFSGRCVLMTMIKYDPLSWLRQWVEFYVKAHGVDAVLLYNNDAPDYSSADIVRALEGIKGLERLVIVEWSFPYGPGAGQSGKWDSAFAQVGAMEQARWRFLQSAHCVINADVDELVFCSDENTTLCDLVTSSGHRYLDYAARWATAKRGAQHRLPLHERRMANSYFLNPRQTENKGKWAAVPARIPGQLGLGVHQIEGARSDPELAGQVSLRHMPEFNAGWKGDRKIGQGMTAPDPIMVRTFKRIGWL